MKAYKLILKLLRHPFSDVVIFGQYTLTHADHNNYLKEYDLRSITHQKLENKY